MFTLYTAEWIGIKLGSLIRYCEQGHIAGFETADGNNIFSTAHGEYIVIVHHRVDTDTCIKTEGCGASAVFEC